MGPGSILLERRHSQLEDITAENGAWPLFLALAWLRLYGEKTVRKAERARFLSEGEESEALGINGARPHLFP